MSDAETDIKKTQNDLIIDHINVLKKDTKTKILYRKDLTKFKHNIPLKDITFYDFKPSSLTIDELFKAELIIFIDDNNETKELKNKYSVW